MKELAALHRKRLLVSFDDSADVTKEREIQATTDGITDLFRDAEKQLTAIAKQEGDESDSELKVRRNLQRSLAFKIQKLSGAFRGQQKEYMNKLRAQKEGALGGEQFAFLNKKEGEDQVVMIPNAASESGFSQVR
jgi:syntaxin 16